MTKVVARSEGRPVFAILRGRMSTTSEAVSGKRARLESIDIVRGAVMIVMALDHDPLCRWFAALKRRRSDPWLSYL